VREDREPAEAGSSQTTEPTATDPVPDRLAVVFDDGRTAVLGGPPLPPPPAPALVPAPSPAPVLDEPAAPAGHPRLRRLLDVVLLAGAWAFATVTMVVRPDGVPTWRTLWAEDGTRFLLGAIGSPGPGPWLEPYAGYLHLIPRMVGSLAVRFPLVDAAAAFAVASGVVAGGALVLLAVGLRRWLPAAWMQAALVVAVAAPPAVAGETAANAANLHWYLTLGLTGLALLRPGRLPAALLAAAVAAAFALSDPFATFVAVLAIADAAWRTVTGPRDLRTAAATWPVPIAIAAGAAMQVHTMIAAPRRPAAWVELPQDDILTRYVRHVVRDGVSPEILAGVTDDTLLLVVASTAAVLLGLVVAAAGARRGVGSHAVIGTLLVAASPGVFALNLRVNHVVADRYAAVPVALLVAGLLVLAAGVPWVGRWLFLATAAAVVTLGMLSFATHPLRGAGPDYLAEARRAAGTQCPVAEFSARVQISPAPLDGSRPRWFTKLPCARIHAGP